MSKRSFNKKFGATRNKSHGRPQFSGKPQNSFDKPKDNKPPRKLVAVVQKAGNNFHLKPTSRKDRNEYQLAPNQKITFQPDDIVMAEPLKAGGFGPIRVMVTENLGRFDAPGAVSLMAIAALDIPFDFPPDVVKDADALQPATVQGREDLRSLPLVTIDGADARDFDDAVFAERDTDAGNEGGFRLVVAIADVSYYVRTGTPLDREAYKRGNSVYFPDRVVPMLPEALSNELCSLKPKVDRACMVAHITIDKFGEMKKFHFTRALMRSAARLTYEQAQAAANGSPDETTKPLMNTVITPLYEAYEVLLKARKKRGTLDLDVQENLIKIDANKRVAHIGPRERLESHKLIEEFMVLANVAAATALQEKGMAGLYRVHDQPGPEKQENLRDFFKAFNINLPAGKDLRSIDLARILEKFVGNEQAPIINEVMLRNQAQAVYSHENIGHFGLALARYAHFTSPIRRYADLVVHRALTRLFKLGEGALSDDEMSRLEETGDHISKTERRAIEAERESNDRYTSLYLAEKVGDVFEGRVSGVTRSGLFIRLKETGADGLLPMASLPGDYYVHDEKNHRLTGKRNGLVFKLADTVHVRLMEADSVTGSLRFGMAEGGAAPAKPGFRTGTRPPKPFHKNKHRHERHKDNKEKGRRR